MQPNLLVTLITYAARGLTIVFILLGLFLVFASLVYTTMAMRKGDLLDTALHLYRANFVTLLAIAAPLIVSFGMLQLLTLGSSEAATFINGLQVLVIGSVVAGALTFASSRIYLRQPVTPLSAYRFGVGKAFSLLGVIVLQALIITLPVVALIVLINLVSIVVPITLILIPFLMIPFIFFVLTKYSVAIPALINEPISALESLDRSARLTEGLFWPTLGVVLATSIVTFLIAELPALALTYLAPASDTPYGIARILLVQIGLIIVMPFHYTVYTLLYYDLRVRQGLSEWVASTAYVPPYASSAASAPMGTVAAEGVGRSGQVRLRE